jgi:hypothetical protein
MSVSGKLFGDMTYLRGVISPSLTGCTTLVAGDVTGCEGNIEDLIKQGKLGKIIFQD